MVDDLERLVRGLPPQLRVAVAAACVERVLPIYELFLDHAARDTVAVAWGYVRGEPVAAENLLELRSALDAGADEYESFLAAVATAVAALHLLGLLKDPTGDDLGHALYYPREAAAVIAGNEKSGCDLEKGWQTRLAHCIASREGRCDPFVASSPLVAEQPWWLAKLPR